MTLSRLSNEKDIVVGLVVGTKQMLMAHTVCSVLQFIKATCVINVNATTATTMISANYLLFYHG